MSTRVSLHDPMILRSDQKPVAMDDQTVLNFLTASLDRTLPTPMGAQLRSIIEFGVSCGSLPVGTRLPSIRSLAQATGLAAETIATAYRTLQASGLLVSYQGSGTFVAKASVSRQSGAEALYQLERGIEEVLILAQEAGLPFTDLLTMLRLRHAQPSAGTLPVLHLAMVGIFEEATKAYAHDIGVHLRPDDVVQALTIEQLRDAPPDPAPDLYVTLPSRQGEVIEIVDGKAPVTSVSVIPSEATRSFLAALSPNTSLALVAKFPTFMGLMRQGAQAFAPHIRDFQSLAVDDPQLAEKLKTADVVVYSTGADAVKKLIPKNRPSAEYRHTLDPHALKDVLLPLVELIRKQANRPSLTPGPD